MSKNERFRLDKSFYDGSFQIVDIEENMTWGRFDKNEQPQLETTVEMLNKLDHNVKFHEELVIILQNELDRVRTQMVYNQKYNKE